MLRRRYRTIHVAQLDRVMAESEAIHRALEGGARRAWVHTTERIVDASGTPVWKVLLRITPPPQGSGVKPGSRQGNFKEQARFAQFNSCVARVYIGSTVVPRRHRKGDAQVVRNLIHLIGRLAADPELRYLDDGTPVANFAIAVNRPFRKRNGEFDTTLDGFFDCELYGGQAVTLGETCTKGTEIQLSGSLRQNKFKTKGENPRTISKTVVRVDSASRVLEVVRESEAVPAAETPQPQPA